ncbi:MAG: hypothetical protein K0U72_13515 [Gammaproteobacteria bacterium]|nr:hypothetical protein [Gammaproteobacteria bacterium]
MGNQMNEDSNDQDILGTVDGSPSAQHDDTVIDAIERASNRIQIRRRRRRFLPLSAAAGVLLAVVLGILLFPMSEDSIPVLRQTGGEGVPGNYVELAEPPQELLWSAAGRAPYRVAMYEDNGDLLWQIDGVNEPALAVSLSQRASLATSGTYYWVVTAESGVESGPYWFRVE